MAFCPEHPKWDQNPKFTPLSETTSFPAPFLWESTPGFNFCASTKSYRVGNQMKSIWPWVWQYFHKVLHVTLFTVQYFPCDVGRSRNFYGRGTRPTACLQLIFPSFLAFPRYLVVNARPLKGWCTGALNFITVSKPRQFTVSWVFVGSSGSRASTILVSHIPKLFPAP